MGRNSKRLVLKVRYTDGKKPDKMFGTRFVLTNNHRNVRGGRGKILQAKKVSWEELFGVGEYNPLPEKLMKEFNIGGNSHA